MGPDLGDRGCDVVWDGLESRVQPPMDLTTTGKFCNCEMDI